MIKRITFIVLLSLPAWVFGQQTDFYSYSFQDIKNNQISLQSFFGKKIVIAIVNAASPDEAYLQKLDSLYRNNSTTLQVIAVPVSNFGKAISNDLLVAIYKRLHLGYILSKVAKGKKEDAGQHSLLNWVTHISSNKRFDNDVEEPGQLFVISENGILYAIVKSKISPTGATMNKIISQQVKTP